MKKDFSNNWKKSKQPRKQRKYRHKAPLHIKQKFTHAHLSKELRKKYGKRSMGLKKGDKVKILRGKFKKEEAKINRIDLKKCRAYIDGIEITKKDGNKIPYPINISNLLIIELRMDDKKREKIVNRKRGQNV